MPGAKDIADRLMASLGSMLLYWHTTAANIGGSKSRPTTIPSAALPAPAARKTASAEWVRAMHTSLILYASTSSTPRHSLARHRRHRIGYLLGDLRRHRRAARPKHGGANEFAFEVQSRYSDAGEAEGDVVRRLRNKEIVIGFGHPVYTTGDPRNQVIKDVARRLSQTQGT